MNKIEKLIKEFCPDGVKWKKLGEVCEFRRGQTITKKEVLEGEIPVVAGGQKPAYYHNEYNREGITISVAGSGAYAGFVSYWEQPIFLSDAFSVEPSDELNIRFLYHWLLSKQMKIYSLKQGVGIPHVYSRDLAKFEIPIPSIETQEKIVKILDSYTEYITELQEKLKIELQARNKQYNYYRDMLLSENYLNKISEKIYEIEENRTLALVSIKEVCIRQRGFSITADEMKKIHKENAPIKIFAGGKTTANIDECNIDKKYIITKPSIIVKSRGNIDFEFYDNPFSHKNELWSYSSNNDKILNIKYLYYYLKKNLKYFEDKAISGKLPQISTGITDNYKIWMPSIIIQNKIVKILDRFQELLSDTKGLLPLEIEQRRKQYEYYREKLLTFGKEEGYALSTAQHSNK